VFKSIFEIAFRNKGKEKAFWSVAARRYDAHLGILEEFYRNLQDYSNDANSTSEKEGPNEKLDFYDLAVLHYAKERPIKNRKDPEYEKTLEEPEDEPPPDRRGPNNKLREGKKAIDTATRNILDRIKNRVKGLRGRQKEEGRG